MIRQKIAKVQDNGYWKKKNKQLLKKFSLIRCQRINIFTFKGWTEAKPARPEDAGTSEPRAKTDFFRHSLR